MLLNTLIWLVMIRSVSNKLMETFMQTTVVNTFYIGVIISMIIGGFLPENIKQHRLFFFWLVFGTFASLLPLSIWVIKSVVILFIVNFSLGFSFGLGAPLCLSYFIENTTYQNRASIAGLLILLSSLCAPILLLLIDSNLPVAIIVSFLWRSTSITTLLSLKVAEEQKLKNPISFLSVLINRSFLAYFAPLFMFCFVDSFERIYHEFFVETDFLVLNRSIEPVFGAIFALIGGMLSDKVGRKHVIIYGFVSVGIAYAILGVAPLWVGTWYIYSIVDGISWGIFYTLFVIVLWGEMAPPNQSKVKFYSIGGIPFFLSELVASLFISNIRMMSREIAFTSFSIAAFFLFLAVIPLLFARETLPEESIRKRELREYLRKAKKYREKYDR